MEIVRATDQDLDPVMSIVHSCIAHMNMHGIDQWDAIYPDRTIFSRDVADGALWMALDGQICRGIIVINEYQDAEYQAVDWQYQGEKIIVVHRLAVDPKSQGQGVGSFLMDFAEDRARVEGYQAIRLDAFSENPGALRLYVKRGYRLAGQVRFRKGEFHCFEKEVVAS